MSETNTGNAAQPGQGQAYASRRGEIETYFDRTALQAWEQLTSDAPVGRIRATVRAGRNEMRSTLLSWLPSDLRGARLLDAGCGTGALAAAAAMRGADVLGVDLSPKLVQVARERAPRLLGWGRLHFEAGDMLASNHGRFDYVVGMDSLIHYEPDDAVRVIASLATRTSTALMFTFAPSTPALAAMHAIGRLFPRGERAPAIVPVAERALRHGLAVDPALRGWRAGRSHRVKSGFYTSQAMELLAP
jgi:magnesium-protoporphyrin O-methyltransferase